MVERGGGVWSALGAMGFLCCAHLGCESSFFEAAHAEADIVLGELGFDDAGGPLLFNHPKGIATDGEVLMLADGNNHRVLVWSSLPEGNTPPDVVIGQSSFEGSQSGEALGRLKWPVDVAAGGGKYAIADTYNHRVLIYEEMPPLGPPSMVFDGGDHGPAFQSEPGPDRFAWPWGVWTDGEKLIIASTSSSSDKGDIHFGGWVLIWNGFPTSADQPADIVLSASGQMGTPRAITTDGETFLMIGDHNAEGQSSTKGGWYWNSFPTENEASPDGFWTEDRAMGWPAGDVSASGELLLMGNGLSVYENPPASALEPPDFRIDGREWHLRGGDGSTVAIADDVVYVSDYNTNRLVGFNGIPQSPQAIPDFVIGADDLDSNTILENHYISNGTPFVAGDMLWIGDALNLRVHCWSQQPRFSGQIPDVTIPLDDEVIDVILHDETLMVATANRGLRVWDSVTDCVERDPDRRHEDKLGSIDANRLQAIARDDTYFYLIDERGDLHVWSQFPEAGEAPEFTVALGVFQGHLHTDGEHLVVSGARDVLIASVSDLGPEASFSTLPIPGDSMMTGQAVVVNEQVFLADVAGHRVFGWSSLDSALDGGEPDLYLGADGIDDIDPDKTASGLFWPMHLAYDGTRLYVAEYKFSGRIMRYGMP